MLYIWSWLRIPNKLKRTEKNKFNASLVNAKKKNLVPIIYTTRSSYDYLEQISARSFLDMRSWSHITTSSRNYVCQGRFHYLCLPKSYPWSSYKDCLSSNGIHRLIFHSPQEPCSKPDCNNNRVR